MSTSIQGLIPEFRPFAKAFVQVVGNAGLLPRITSTRRTSAEQTRLYDAYIARGRTGLPAAPPGTSAHEYGYAFDMVVSPFAYLSFVGSYWNQLGGVWHPSDPVHFEYPGFKPPEAIDTFWRTIYKGLDYASWIATPLGVRWVGPGPEP